MRDLDLRIIDPSYFDPALEEASYYEWIEEQELEEEEKNPNKPDYSILDSIPLEDLPF